jgi:transcriptional regulator with XRE-family HTH domain
VPIQAALTVIAAKRSRASPRRKLRIAAAGLTADGPETVNILDLSVTGMLIECAVRLAVGESLHVELPEAGSTLATVVWSGGNFFGCQFDEPLSPATVSAAALKGEPLRASPAAATAADDRLPARIRRLRQRRGWSLESLARRLGVSRQTIWYWESGRNKPGGENLGRLARLLGPDEEGVPMARPATDLAALIRAHKSEIAAWAGTTGEKVRITIEI